MKIDDRVLNLIIVTSLLVLAGVLIVNWGQFSGAAL